MLAKNSLALAKQGYELMDKKRNILIRELMELIDQARTIQEEIDSTFTYAYQCLQKANIENGSISKGKRSDGQAIHGGKRSISAGFEYQENTKTGKCTAEYYNSDVYRPGNRYQ